MSPGTAKHFFSRLFNKIWLGKFFNWSISNEIEEAGNLFGKYIGIATAKAISRVRGWAIEFAIGYFYFLDMVLVIRNSAPFGSYSMCIDEELLGETITTKLNSFFFYFLYGVENFFFLLFFSDISNIWNDWCRWQQQQNWWASWLVHFVLMDQNNDTMKGILRIFSGLSDLSNGFLIAMETLFVILSFIFDNLNLIYS